MLVHVDPTQEIVSSCDALAYGIGAVLADGSEKPIGVASWTLSNAEISVPRLKMKGLLVFLESRDFVHSSMAIPSH